MCKEKLYFLTLRLKSHHSRYSVQWLCYAQEQTLKKIDVHWSLIHHTGTAFKTIILYLTKYCIYGLPSAVQFQRGVFLLICEVLTLVSMLGGAPLLKNGCCEIHMWQLKIIEIASSATTTVLSVWSATGTLGALFWMMLHSYWNGKTPPSPISLWKHNLSITFLWQLRHFGLLLYQKSCSKT